MYKYLTILLDDTSVAFCHADNPLTERKLIPIDTLKKAVFYAMKENLSIQYVYPNYDLTDDYLRVIASMDHTDIVPVSRSANADIVVVDDISHMTTYVKQANLDSVYVIRCTTTELWQSANIIEEAVKTLFRVNVVIKDVRTFNDNDIERYEEFLEVISESVYKSLINNRNPQTNLLTDRLALDYHNNCNAGDESITLAPNGKFYVCPAFYYDEYLSKGQDFSTGDLEKGINLKNGHLYKINFAPICRKCDAYHCKRCVWLNKELTRETNTPSRQQCIMAHLERNASKRLWTKLKNNGFLLESKEIPEIDYLDPFELLTKNR